jgi:hypothetical protein
MFPSFHIKNLPDPELFSITSLFSPVIGEHRHLHKDRQAGRECDLRTDFYLTQWTNEL